MARQIRLRQVPDLRRRRLLVGLTLTELARHARVSAAWLSEAERETRGKGLSARARVRVEHVLEQAAIERDRLIVFGTRRRSRRAEEVIE